jgi:hypothetical protein
MSSNRTVTRVLISRLVDRHSYLVFPGKFLSAVVTFHHCRIWIFWKKTRTAGPFVASTAAKLLTKDAAQGIAAAGLS